MVASIASTQLEEILGTTVTDLRHGMLKGFLYATAVAHIIWYYFVAATNYRFYFHTSLILILMPFFYLILKNYQEKFEKVVWLLIGIIFLWNILVVFRFPDTIAICLGIIGTIVAMALQSSLPALGVTTLMWTGGMIAQTWSRGVPSLQTALGSLGLYLLVWGASWLANRPMRASVLWAMAGWTEARTALDEVQSRRAELYRALRALEEATYRIERMNHELIEARREAELAREQKTRFANTVSHELRGPLSIVLGFTRLMATQPKRYGQPLPDPYMEDMDAVYRNTQHIVDLINDVLDLGQIEVEKLSLVKDRVDLAVEVVHKAVSIVQPLANRKGLTLRHEIANDLPQVIIDPVRVRQALLNLLVNAVRFTSEGEVLVLVTCQDDSILVKVQDTGTGIASDAIPKLFAEFSQLEEQEDAEKGSGLGLSISKELIELHGGRIWVESQVGVGTTVCFTVPLMGTRPLVSDVDYMARRATPGMQAECCLVVHDDPNILGLFARYLEGYRVIGLPDVGRAVDLAHQLHPRAILMDRSEAVNMERALAAAQLQTPLITCNMPHMGDRVEFQHVVAYLIKPVLPEALQSVMKRVENRQETTILLVDDNPDAVRLLESTLKAMPRPYLILKAYTGAQALEHMRQYIPDVVFLDLVMPEVSGEDVLAAMRDDERLHQVPVVIVSARDWALEGAMLQPPISLRAHGSIGIARAAQCFRALLDLVRPDYLTETTHAAQP